LLRDSKLAAHAPEVAVRRPKPRLTVSSC
jgi:hypothetical protein